jgi:glycogen operon protein
MLMVSQGVPMICMGDEIGHTKQGNNNTYAQDNELSWLDWASRPQNEDIFRFFQLCIAFRKEHPALRNQRHFAHEDLLGSGYADITWHGAHAWLPDWSYHSRTLAFMLDGRHARGGSEPDDTIYVAMNMHWEAHRFDLPRLPRGMRWRVFVNTGAAPGAEICEPGHEPLLSDQRRLLVGARSVIILVGRAGTAVKPRQKSGFSEKA